MTRTSDDRQYISRLRSNDPTLTTLNISYISIDDEDIEHLVTALAFNSTLTTLDLTGNDIGAGAGRLALTLASNCTLSTLVLNHNRIGAEAAGRLAMALRVNSILSTLSLRSCDISGAGATQLVTSLCINTTLTSLDLLENPIPDNDFGDLLRSNSSLTSLALPLKSSLREFSAALFFHPSLISLDCPYPSAGSYLDFIYMNYRGQINCYLQRNVDNRAKRPFTLFALLLSLMTIVDRS